MGQNDVNDRDIMPDMIRAFALIGIVMVNVEFFSGGLNGYSETQKAGALNHAAVWGVAGLFALKSFSLFSLMFGAGLGYQLAAAEKKQQPMAGKYFRRMSGLLAFGLLHAIFFFIGDILVTYAILGSFLFLFRKNSIRVWVIWAGIFISLQAGLLLLGGLAPEEPANSEFNAQWAEMVAAYQSAMKGSFFEAAASRLSLLPIFLGIVLGAQGIAAFGYFLFGLTFYKLGWLSDPHHKFWWWCRWVALPIGIIASFWAGQAYIGIPRGSPAEAVAIGFLMLFATFSTLGYMGLIAKLCQREAGSIMRFFSRGGSASLTAYLTQSLILSFVFCGYGLGLIGELDAFQSACLALLTGVFTICFTSLWLKRFKRGPLEIIFRRWINLGR